MGRSALVMTRDATSMSDPNTLHNQALASLHSAKRVVVKLGTAVVIQEKGILAIDRLFRIVNQCANLLAQRKEVILVTSGAVGLGRKQLGLNVPLPLADKQACAAVGQTLLMDAYRELFRHHNRTTAQILVSATDFADRKKYLNLQKTLERLLSLGVVPIINENDSVSTTELIEHAQTESFGDNDKLSAIVASKLPADLLFMLTNVDGLYTENPKENPNAEAISLISDFNTLHDIGLTGQSSDGRGGMASKVEAARVAALSGVTTIIASGFQDNVIDAWLSHSAEAATFPSGTLVLPNGGRMPEKKHWIGVASGHQGIITVNQGAKDALVGRFASLLAVGITSVQGQFKPYEVVSIQDQEGDEVGRGIIEYSADDTRRIMGVSSSEIPQRLDHLKAISDVVIHRDNLVIYEEYRVS